MGLTVKQQAAIEALLEGNTITGAAQAAGIGRRTLQRYFSEPDFKAALRAGSDAAIMAAAARLSKLSDDAIQAMQAVMAEPTEPGASIKLRAADTILGHIVKIREQSDILERLAALEAQQEGGPL